MKLILSHGPTSNAGRITRPGGAAVTAHDWLTGWLAGWLTDWLTDWRRPVGSVAALSHTLSDAPGGRAEGDEREPVAACWRRRRTRATATHGRTRALSSTPAPAPTAGLECLGVRAWNRVGSIVMDTDTRTWMQACTHTHTHTHIGTHTQTHRHIHTQTHTCTHAHGCRHADRQT